MVADWAARYSLAPTKIGWRLMILSFGYFLSPVIQLFWIRTVVAFNRCLFFSVFFLFGSCMCLASCSWWMIRRWPLQAGSSADRAPTTAVTSFPSTPQGNDSVPFFFLSTDVCDPNVIYRDNCCPFQSKCGCFFVHLIIDMFSSLNLLWCQHFLICVRK
jgi:hypothetical protein